jgi:hypothetical protein
VVRNGWFQSLTFAFDERMKAHLIAIALCVFVLGCDPSNPSAPLPEVKPDEQPPALDLSKFRMIRGNMTTDEIMEILGKPDRNNGGIFWIGEYDQPDGTLVFVTADGENVLSVNHVDRKNGHSTELLKKNSEQQDQSDKK